MTRCKLETQTTADRLARAAEDREHHRSAASPSTGPTVVHGHRRAARSGRGVPQRADRSGRELRPLVERGGSYTFTLKPNIVVQLREDTVNQALQTIERRVNELGVAEPIVARHSAADQILVQLPGVTDVDRAKEIIRSTALLELKQVEQGPFSDESAARAGARRQRAAGHADSAGHDRGGARPAGRHRSTTCVRRVPAVTGRDLRNARPTLDENNRPAVSFSLNQEGARKFGTLHAGATSAASSASCSTTACSRRRSSSRASTTKAASPATSPTRKRRTCR